MNIDAASVLTLQACSLNRRDHRARLIAHRRARSMAFGPSMRLQFEDELTVRHQIHEVLRAERAADEHSVRQEIRTWSHLVPDGTQWKATLMIELPDATERARLLPLLSEAAHHVYVQVGTRWRVTASANEDLADRHLARPSGVHFLRFQLPETFRAALLAGKPARLGCAHAECVFEQVIPPTMLQQLVRDLTLPRKRCDTEPATGLAEPAL
jgi:hypothetical protein